MPLKFIAGIGWIDAGDSASGLTKVSAPDSSTVGTDNVGNLVTGDLIYTPATEGQYGTSVNGVAPDPNAKVGSPGWVAYNFPEYIDERGDVLSTGVKVQYPSNRAGVSITRSRNFPGMQNPWGGADESYWKQLGEDERKSYFDSINWFRNEGQGIDPRLLSGMVADNPFAPKGQQTASNKYGTMTLGQGVSLKNPYGVNASFQGKDYAGNAYNWQQKHWGYVQQRPGDGEKYVPGWATTARLVGDPSYVPVGYRNMWGMSGRQYPTPPWMDLEPGTNITGRYGWPKQGATGFSGFGT